jgi:hypothetical protein
MVFILRRLVQIFLRILGKIRERIPLFFSFRRHNKKRTHLTRFLSLPSFGPISIMLFGQIGCTIYIYPDDTILYDTTVCLLTRGRIPRLFFFFSFIPPSFYRLCHWLACGGSSLPSNFKVGRRRLLPTTKEVLLLLLRCYYSIAHIQININKFHFDDSVNPKVCQTPDTHKRSYNFICAKLLIYIGEK